MVDLRSLRRGCWIPDSNRAGHVDLFQQSQRVSITGNGVLSKTQDLRPLGIEFS